MKRSLLIAVALSASVAFAQATDIRVERVRFAEGETGTTLDGTLRGRDIVDYRLRAEAGQTMIVALTPESPATYFNIIAPGETEVAFFIGSAEGNSYVGRLPETGDYTIRVYQVRSAARRGEVATYALDVEITSADYADALGGGPDFWEVTGLGASGTLELRESPSVDGSVVGHVEDGTVLRNQGCRIYEGSRWCSVEIPDDSSRYGWVLGEFLMESSYLAPRRPADSLVPGTEFHATGFVPCARYSGQAMMQCEFGVVREGGGSGYVKVFWSDGGNRVVFFEAGVPSSFDRSEADGDAQMTVSKESDLFTIRIGKERFEIPEAAISGG